MAHVAELSVSSSSFLRGFTGESCEHSSQRLTSRSLSSGRSTVSVPALRCGLTSSADGTIGMMKKINSKASPQGVSCRAFGASLKDGYSISDPEKISGASLGEGNEFINRLKQGFKSFKEQKYEKDTELWSKLKEGQSPKAMVIACADSRVCPTMLLGVDPGDVFVVRNVANLVPPFEKGTNSLHGTSAALEFAVTGLKVEHIIVIGHRNCGGIKALMSRGEDELESDFIGSWIACAKPAKKQTLVQMEGKSFAEKCQYCEKEAVNGSLANLLTFPWIKERFENGTLGLHGWYYDFVEGELESWEVQKPALAIA